MIPDVLEMINTMSLTNVVTVIEIIVIVAGITLSVLVLRARAGMKRMQAARMLSLWIWQIGLRLAQDGKTVDIVDIQLPTHIYDGLVTSGLISLFDEDTQLKIDNLHQLVYVHNKDGNSASRRNRIPEMKNDVVELNDVVNNLKKRHRVRLRVIARLFD